MTLNGKWSGGVFALRTPLLPFMEMHGMGEAGPTGAETGCAPVAEDRFANGELLWRKAAALLERPEVQEALFLGSPDLYKGLSVWRQHPESENGQRIGRALYRYLARMSSRPTPFGLFAGCSLGRIGAEARLEVAGREEYQRRSRLDMEYLYSLAEKVARDPALRQELVFRPNTSLYEVGGKYHYAEGRFDGKRRSYHLVAVEKTPYLEATLSRANEGTKAKDLAKGLVSDDPEIGPEEAAAYVSELTDNQVLVADLMPLVTGGEPIGDLIEKLKRLPGAESMAAGLAKVQKALGEIDEAGPGVGAATYMVIAEKLKELPAETHMERLFQVDMIKPAPKAMLSERVAGEILDGVEMLHRMAPPEDEDALSRFKSGFLERYQDREVPLCEVMDEETGLGFERSGAPGAEAAPLLAGIPFAASAGESKVSWTQREAFLFGKLEEVRQRGDLELRLEAKDLEALTFAGQKPLPEAFSAMASIASSSCGDIATGQYRIYLHGASGPSGARLLGRFCHADEELRRCVEQHLRAEEALHPDAIFAEIVHLPEGRIGNILFRPCLREYEIPFLGRPGAPREKQIPVTDLVVSLRGGRVLLRSKRLNKEIIPRLTSAHNHGLATNLKLYKFLCQTQTQGCTGGVGWNWGILEQSAFLPRVSHGRLVFSRARWRLDKQTIHSFAKKRGAERFEAFRAWSEENKAPRFVALADGDNELLIDRDDALAVETLAEYVKNRPEARLVEMFPGPDELCCGGPEGRFVHELVVPFVRKPDRELAKGRSDGQAVEFPATASAMQRTLPPGSEWLYAKLFASPSHSDRLLQDVVAPLAWSALASGAADLWFFIRYGDPEWHLRVRFHGSPARLLKSVLPLLNEGTADPMTHGLLWRLQLDTYDREIERYGGDNGMILAEALFHHDSEAVIRLLGMLRGDEGAEARWKLALVGIDRLLADMGLDLSAKHRLLSNLRDSFAREFKVGGSFKKGVSDRFRKERGFLDSLLDSEAALESDLAPGVRILEGRSEAWKPVMEELMRQAKTGRLTASLDDLAGSFVHMHVNRMLRSAQRAQEAVLYHFLAQLYESRLARARKGASGAGVAVGLQR